ncbi:hypothetical protein HORIV_59780 [Vreelandella olivaria]|uniref:Mandelate racemase/muconate lactonizing enzyme N-terminal domain-containing protein n=1 Tax=Vreelandella olivaria TaxID=390919 RepID=A0ABN5X610_9GAMM|nr:hypothetical protein HORIV_59780 [Halomonas olivaria]
MTTITRVEIQDIRFPTSRSLDGSDAMNAAPDYSAAYVILHTDDGSPEGHGLTFTIGRGNEIVVTALQSLSPLIEGRTLASMTDNMGTFWREITGDSQLRWIGPDKGAIHLATAAIVNAVWDMWAKNEGKPVWKLLVDMTPEQLVRCLDFRFVTDALTPEEAICLLRRQSSGKAAREAEMRSDGYPPTPPPQAGWATATRKCAAWPGKRWPKAGRTSSRRLAAISKRTPAARRCCARRSAGTTC